MNRSNRSHSRESGQTRVTASNTGHENQSCFIGYSFERIVEKKNPSSSTVHLFELQFTRRTFGAEKGNGEASERRFATMVVRSRWRTSVPRRIFTPERLFFRELSRAFSLLPDTIRYLVDEASKKMSFDSRASYGIVPLVGSFDRNFKSEGVIHTYFRLNHRDGHGKPTP